MGHRRMFSKSVTDDERFSEMPVDCQNLYFHLGMSVDDDGFVNPHQVMRSLGVGDDTLKVLIAKSWVVYFPDRKVCLIRHHRVNNNLRADWHRPSPHRDLLCHFEVSNEKSYVYKLRSDSKYCLTGSSYPKIPNELYLSSDTNRIQTVSVMNELINKETNTEMHHEVKGKEERNSDTDQEKEPKNKPIWRKDEEIIPVNQEVIEF